jgi:hypothetical protein
VEKGTDLAKEVILDNAPNLGIGAAVGKVAAEAFKHTGGMAPVPRIAVVGTTALATAAGTKIGLDPLRGKALMENKKIENKIVENKLDAVETGGRNSPSAFDGGFIYSVLEESEIPLITVVNGLCYFNYIEFSLILALFSLLFRKYLKNKIKSLILRIKLKNKYIKNTKCEAAPLGYSLNVDSFGVSLNKAFNTVDKYTDYLIVFIFICLFWIKFINIYCEAVVI